MHVALVQNIGPRVDWQVVVVWTCLLVLYQTQVAADAEASVEAEAARVKAENNAVQILTAATQPLLPPSRGEQGRVEEQGTRRPRRSRGGAH